MMSSALLVAALASSPSAAMTKGEFMDLVAPLAEIETNQRLEKEFSGLVENKDDAGLQALAERIRRDNGKALDELRAMAERAETQGAPQGADGDAPKMLMLGPCHYAGLFLRIIAVGVANGDAKAVFRKDTVMIDDADIDSTFADYQNRCEVLKTRDRDRKRHVGTSCYMTGSGCADDPDTAADDPMKK